MAYNQDDNPRGTDLSTWNFRPGEKLNGYEYASRYSFAIVKYTENTYITDQDAENTVNGLSAYSTPFGGYHYFKFISGESTKKQAEYFASVTKSLGMGELGAYGDFEDGSANNNIIATKRLWISEFLDRVEQKLGSECGIYTNAWWNTHVANAGTGVSSIPNVNGKPRRLWIANWGVTQPYIPYDWKIRYGNNCYTFHQDTNRLDGTDAGIPDTTVDGNWYNGSYSQFNSEFNTNISFPGTPTNPPLPQPDPDTKIIEITGLKGNATLRMRQKAWGDVKAYTWNGERFPVQKLIGYTENPERYWIQVCGNPDDLEAPENLVVASWYTKIIE